MSKNVLIFLYTFRRKWMDLKLILDNNGSVIASDILASMKKREEELFGTGLILLDSLLQEIFIFKMQNAGSMVGQWK